MKIIAFGLLLWVSSALAWAGALQGTVKDSGGHPIKGAEIRIEGIDGNLVKAIKSDARGHYFADGLAIGTDYKLSLIVNGSIKASLLNALVRISRPNSVSICVRRTGHQINIWSGSQTNLPGPILAEATGRSWMLMAMSSSARTLILW